MFMNTVPIQFDAFAFLTFLGIVQGLFLLLFFFNKNHRMNPSNRYLGFFILCLILTITDSFLCYTNIMFDFIYLNDSTEAISLLIFPFIYLSHYSKLNNRLPDKIFLHFLPAIIYFLFTIPYLISPIEIKYNAYITAYHPNLDHLNLVEDFPFFMAIKDYISALIILSTVFYMLKITKLIIKHKKRKQSQVIINSYLKPQLVLLLIFFVLFSVIRVFIERDLGDFYITIYLSFVIYSISFFMIKSSNFFKLGHEKKYVKSTLSDEQKQSILEKVQSEFKDHDYYLNEKANLSDLSKRLHISANYISQVINECLAMTYSDLLSSYRIEKSKELILENSITIEAIAYEVGYQSKTAFNNAFKKITGLTPSEYRALNK